MYHAAPTWPSHITLSEQTFSPHFLTYFNQVLSSTMYPYCPPVSTSELDALTHDILLTFFIFTNRILCLQVLSSCTVSNANQRHHFSSRHAIPNPTRTTLLPRFPTSVVVPRHSQTQSTSLPYPQFRTQHRGPPRCMI